MADKDYSGTPLPRKLGIGEGTRVRLIGAPEGFVDSLAPLPPGVEILRATRGPIDVVVLFATRASELARRFAPLANALDPGGRLWVAWPKKAARVETDLDFGAVQGIGLDAGLVDNKSASVTEVFQGLQFVYRLVDRPTR